MKRFSQLIILAACLSTSAAAQDQSAPAPSPPPAATTAPQPVHHTQHAAAKPKAAPANGEPQLTEEQKHARDTRAQIIRENNFGVALMNRQQFEAALGKFQRACILDPNSDVGCLNAGIALLNMQRFDDARQLLDKAAQRDPRNPRAWFNLGLLEKANGNVDAAVADFQKVAAIDPYDADTQYFLGLIYAQQPDYKKAVAAFQKAVALNPFQVSAEFGLAQALQRSGDTTHAKDHFERFQHMTAAKLGKPVSFIYGEQGKYSLAQVMQPAPEPAPPTMPIKFASVVGSGFPVATAEEIAAADPLVEAVGAAKPTPRTARVKRPAKSASEAPEPDALARFLGSGACVIDYDGDGKPDIFLADADGKGTPGLYKNMGHGYFENVTRMAKLEIKGRVMGCAVGDYDNDMKPDLAVTVDGRVALFHNEGNGTFKDVTEESGITSDPTSQGNQDALALGLTFIDYDHDGDVDLYVTRFNDFPFADSNQPFDFPSDAVAPGNVLWRNNGNKTFTEWTTETSLAGSGPSVGALASDVNNDRAIDFVVTGWQKTPTVYLNQREGAFKATTPWASEMPGPTAGVVALDFNKDGWMDYAFTHWATPGLSLWRNVDGKSFERVDLPDLDWMRGWGVAAFDYDNDGFVDLVAVGESFSGEGRIVLLRNEGAAGFRDVTTSVGLDKIALHRPRGIVAFDLDGNGSVGLLITQAGLPPVLLRNDGGDRYNWIRIDLKGEADNRTGIGTKVEMFAGAMQQKWEVPGSSGYLGQGPAQIVAGLGAERQADVVRLLWPTGVLQDEMEIPAHKTEVVTEIDRRGSSCPIVFSWNGEKFEFIGDMLGPGIVGHWVAPDKRNTPDPDEYLKVSGSQVQAKDGKIQFRMVEPMEELDYLDQTKLIAVDHPSDVEVYPNERFLSEPPFPEFKVIASSGAHLPSGAWDDKSRNILPLLAERDKKYVANFGELPYAGFAPMHWIEIDLGPWDPANPLRLLMDGWTDYFSASSMYAAWQAGVVPIPPYVEAQDDSGKWVNVIDDMGFPAGLERTMVADLTGKLQPETRFIRISTNLRIYWDRIRVENSPTDTPYKLTEVPLAGAKLGFLGYPKFVEGKPANDLSYIYEQVSATGPYSRQIGNYTRYGDVTELVKKTDDEYVIYGSGDEVAVDFDATSLPDLPDGWTRDYFFYADGFAKDMDFYAAHGDTVAPLPFHTTATYPYPKGVAYPLDPAHLNYMLEYNTRGIAGPPGASYQFDYTKPDSQ
ncbi:MAG: FG-GAP-like repeat-containing protein [Candidatus Acidiferrales bacterium]